MEVYLKKSSIKSNPASNTESEMITLKLIEKIIVGIFTGENEEFYTALNNILQ